VKAKQSGNEPLTFSGSRFAVPLLLLPSCNNVGRKNASVAFDFSFEGCFNSLVWEDTEVWSFSAQ
jgi:hypothetical protein